MHKGYIANGVLGIHIPGIRSSRSIAMRMGEFKVKILQKILHDADALFPGQPIAGRLGDPPKAEGTLAPRRRG